MIKQPMAFLFGALLMAPAAQAEIITFDPSFTYRELELRKIDTGIWPQSLLLGLMGELNKAKDRTEVLEQVKAAILANDYASDKGHEALVLKNAVFGFDRDLKDLRLSDLAGRKDFAGAMFIAGSSLGKADFREADFTDAILQGVDFSSCKLEKTLNLFESNKDFSFASNIYHFDKFFPNGPNTILLQAVARSEDTVMFGFDPSRATNLFCKTWGPKGRERLLTEPAGIASLHLFPGTQGIMVNKKFQILPLGSEEETWVLPEKHRPGFQVAESMRDEFTYLCSKGVFAQRQKKAVQLCERAWETSDKPLLALGPDRTPWVLRKAGHSLGTIVEGKLQWQDLGQGSSPAQILSDDKLLFVRLEGRSSILIIEPSLRETIKENLVKEEKKADLALKEELRKLKGKKNKEQTRLTSSSSSSSSSSSFSASLSSTTSLETKEIPSTRSLPETISGSTWMVDPSTGQWSSTYDIDFKHILEGHSYGLDSEDGQFNKDADKDWIEHWVAEALHGPTAWGPTASRSSRRWIYYREFKDVIGRAMGQGQWWPTRRMQVVLDENWGKPYVVSAYPVLGIPRHLRWE